MGGERIAYKGTSLRSISRHVTSSSILPSKGCSQISIEALQELVCFGVDAADLKSIEIEETDAAKELELKKQAEEDAKIEAKRRKIEEAEKRREALAAERKKKELEEKKQIDEMLAAAQARLVAEAQERAARGLVVDS